MRIGFGACRSSRKPGVKRADLLSGNAGIAKNSVEACATHCLSDQHEYNHNDILRVHDFLHIHLWLERIYYDLVTARHPLPALSAYKEERLKAVKKQLQSEIDAGLSYAALQRPR